MKGWKRPFLPFHLSAFARGRANAAESIKTDTHSVRTPIYKPRLNSYNESRSRPNFAFNKITGTCVFCTRRSVPF